MAKGSARNSAHITSEHRQHETHSYFVRRPSAPIYTVRGFVDALGAPCGRFRSPLTWRERFDLSLARLAAASGAFESVAVLPQHVVPPNWQVLLNYLHGEGIVAEPAFTFWPQANDAPRFDQAGLQGHFDPARTDGKDTTASLRGLATAASSEEMYSKVVGELLERYFLTLYRRRDLRYTSYAELAARRERAFDPAALPGFLPWQADRFPRLRYDRGSALHWMRVQELTAGSPAWVPAQLVYWGYDTAAAPAEPTLRQPTTNGAAGSFTFADSVVRAVCEAVERDAFLIHWLNTLAPPVLDLGALEDAGVRALLESAARHGLELYFLDTTTDLPIPSCACVVVDRRGKESRLTVGGAAGFDAAANIVASAREALNVRGRLGDASYALPKDYMPFTSTAIGKDERTALWRGETMVREFSFFLSGRRVPLAQSAHARLARRFASAEEAYRHVLEVLRGMGAGYELYCHEVKHPVLDRLGFHVTKAVIPALVPLYLSESLATLDAARLRDVPRTLGFTDTKLNPWPHPFP